MPNKKSTTKKTTKTTKTVNISKPRAATTKTRHKNRCKSVILFGVVLLVLCVVVAGVFTICSLISRYQATNAHISDFSLIVESDRYNTIAMNDDRLEIIASDWGAPATERQIKVDLKTGKAEAVVHYGRTDVGNCAEGDTNCINDEVYYGKLSDNVLAQITNSAKAILGDQTKSTYSLGEVATNEALVEICQTVIDDLKED